MAASRLPSAVACRVVAFDVDGVLADSIHGFDAWACAHFGVSDAEVGPLDDYADPISRWPAQHHAALQRAFVEAYFSGAHGVYERAQVIPGALDGVRALAEAGLASGYVTRRPSTLHALTRAWLERHGFPSLPLAHADGEQPKAPHVRALGARVMVEDSPKEAAALARAGVQVLLRHEPYNARLAAPGVVRCDGWDAVLARALAAARGGLPEHGTATLERS